MPDERPSRWPLLLVLAAALAVHARALGGELVYDDLQMIARNPGIRSLAHVPRFFAQDYWAFLGAENAAYNGYWRPLTATALALAHAAGGGSVPVFHAASLLVHLGATAAAYGLAVALTRDRAAACFAALLFALHPVQVESVAWITALNDPLFGLFGLLALLAFARWRERGSRGVPLGASLSFALALLSKELAVALLPMALLVDLLRPRSPELPTESPGRLLGRIESPLRAYGGFALVLLLYYGARVAVFGEPTAGLERVTTYFGVGARRLALLRVELLGGGMRVLAWPIGLNVFRPFRPALPLSDPAFVGALIALLAYLVLLTRALLGRRRAEALALLLVPAGLLPVLLRVSSLGRFPLSDRFLYLPAFGFALYLALLARRLLPARAAGAALAAVALFYALATWQRIGVWHDEEALFRSALEADPESPYAHWGLGRVLLERSRTGQDPGALAEAFTVYDRAMKIVEDALAHRETTAVFVSGADVLQVNLGYGFCLLLEAQTDEFHDFDTPGEIFSRLLERIYAIRSETEEAQRRGIPVLVEHVEVEQVHTALGLARMLAGRAAEAEASFQAALAENESYPEAHRNYGLLLMKAGDFERARRHFERALELRPGNYQDELLLAQSLLEGGWTDEAEQRARALNARDPAEPEALMILATVALRRSDASAALRWLDQVRAASPQHGYAWYLRARALLTLGETQQATESFRRAAELLPSTFEVRYDFGAFLLSSGAQAAAAQELVAAYGLCRDPNRCLDLRETLRGLPLSASQAVELASIERTHQRPDAALEWLSTALAQEPNNGLALLELGRALQDQGDLPGAANALTSACTALPSAFVPRYELAQLFTRMERPEDALTRLREAQSLGPPATWEPDQRTAVARGIDQQIRELEAKGGFIGPPKSDG